MNGISARTSLLIGDEGVELLRSSYIVIAGAGAVGGYAIEAMIRAGAGRIRVIDGDTFTESNLNRQILATHDTIGMCKSDAARNRARAIDPTIEFEAIHELLTKDSDLGSLIGRPDVLIDAIDTVENKAALLRYAAENNIRTFSSMGAALHMDPEAIKIAPLKKTKVCPLAASIRSKTRDLDTSMITCVYSEEPPIVRPTETDDHGKSVLGSIPTIPAIFGMILANEAIRCIISKSTNKGLI